MRSAAGPLQLLRSLLLLPPRPLLPLLNCPYAAQMPD